MTAEAEVIAKSVLGGAQQLRGELSRGVIYIIVSNASQIPSFNSRREELTSFQAEYLFYYAFGLVLFSRTIQTSWSNRDVEPILEAAADDLSRRIAYSSGAQTDVEQIRAGVLSNARGMYEATKDNFGRVLGGEGQPDDIFSIVTLNLMEAFPGAASLMMERPALFSAIMQRFGTLSLAGAVGASEAEMSARPKPSRPGGFLRGFFSRN
jgi:hypothetical protein